jgi:hypothetical protein
VYLVLVAILLLATFVQSRLALPSLAEWLQLPNPRAIAGGVLCAALAFGLLGAQRHAARARAPWRVPQSQPLILFLLFFVLGAAGLVLSV